MSEQAVREAFLSQAEFCFALGSPFTGALCRALARVLDRHTGIGRRLLDWPGDPSAKEDNVPLRLCGGLHALVRAGRSPDLLAFYPPAPMPDDQTLKSAVAAALVVHDEWLDPWLDTAPQTNEVGRSAVLMAGLLAITDRFALPMRLYELGASAGLNLQLDHFSYDLGGRCFGDPASKVRLSPSWEGEPPPDCRVEIADRHGVDINPMDPAKDAERLLAYVWPDQPERLERLAPALDIARRSPVPIARGDAADWIEKHLSIERETGIVRVILHSIAFQYFSDAAQARIRNHLSLVGQMATEDAPLAWLRLELLPEEPSASLRLRTWPGTARLLAWAHPHGSFVSWL